MTGKEQNEKDFENLSKEQILKCWKTLKSVTDGRWRHENYILEKKSTRPIELYESRQRRRAIEEFLSMMRFLERTGYLN